MKSKFKLAFILLAIGFILLALDVDVSTGVKYPHDYSNSNNVIGNFNTTILHQTMVLNVLISLLILLVLLIQP